MHGLYQYLASRAIGAGAQLRVSHTVEQIIMENGYVAGVTVKNHMGERMDIRAAVTIDATGVSRHIAARTEYGQCLSSLWVWG